MVEEEALGDSVVGVLVEVCRWFLDLVRVRPIPQNLIPSRGDRMSEKGDDGSSPAPGRQPSSIARDGSKAGNLFTSRKDASEGMSLGEMCGSDAQGHGGSNRKLEDRQNVY